MGRTLDPARLGDHIDRLYRAACALTGNRLAADDLVQETYARVLAKPRLLKNDDDIGYLVRTMRNIFLDQRRQAARRATDAADPEDFERIERRGGVAARGGRAARAAWRRSPRLPEEFRDVLVAVDVVGLSYKEAPTLLGRARGDGDEPALPRAQAGDRRGSSRVPRRGRGA